MAGATAVSLRVLAASDALADENGGRTTDLAVSPLARSTHNLGELNWKLCGFVPFLWSFDKFPDLRNAPDAEVGPIDAPVPGSVQAALLHAGIIEDWNVGLNYRDAEWVENRDWIYQAHIPDNWISEGSQIRLRCAGLDYSGHIMLNGQSILPVCGSFTAHEVDLKPHLKKSGNLLQIWLQPPPRWLGQFGYTSQIKQWKPRFNYSWDWTIRLVQIGIWDSITLEVVRGAEIVSTKCSSGVMPESGLGSLRLSVKAAGGEFLRATLSDGSRIVRHEMIAVGGHAAEISWDSLPVDLWWPNGCGKQALYTVQVQLLDEQKRIFDSRTLRVGFRHIEWKRTQGAAADAHPYLCVVNGRELFLFGVNWTPIRPTFADVGDEDYRRRVALYQDIGVNIFRVWGGGFAERDILYNLADEKGILIWQEFPLSSSGMDNDPPDDAKSIREMSAIAASYIERLQHHASLLLWCGGNELEDNLAGHVSAQPTLTIDKHPLILRLGDIVRQSDPGRCFLPTSPYGPVGSFSLQTCGEKKHWDVHGPWDLDGPVEGSWRELWQHDDAMFHSEMGAPSTSSAEMIRRYKGNLPDVPGTHSNALWNRQPWWIEWPKFALETGREPASLDEFVAWSQKRQAEALTLAVSAAKSRFPACGGVILWMGHDCFPCTANASIVDFDGNPKPAALALRRIFHNS
jgi:beta-mannosidase